MFILGVFNAIDSGACLLKDGKILAAVNEERFVRKKNIATFPKYSIDYVLKNQNLKIKDILVDNKVIKAGQYFNSVREKLE